MNRLPKILAIDDDPNWLSQVPLIFEDNYEVICCETIDQGLVALNTDFFDIVLLDLNFPGETRTGLDLFKQIAAADKNCDVIVISGETRPEKLIQILNSGITKFIPKPSNPREVRNAVQDAIRNREVRFRAINAATAKSGDLIGSSAAMLKLREEIDAVVKGGARDILLVGETGTGKEVVAKTIAALADSAKRFVPIHCGAIADGIAESELFGHVRGAFTGADKDRASAFEIVGGGYVFLDEIGDMPSHQQAKLLRVLQERKVQRVGSVEERPVSFKCISATNINLENAVKEKRFREDLYYRIAKAKIQVPSLRERSEDIPELVHHFIGKQCKKVSITEEALELLQTYSWPGNVRQLESTIEAMVPRCKDAVIRERDVCQAIPELGQLYTAKVPRTFLGKEGSALIASEKQRFQKALIEARGDRTKAAQILKISRATFYRRIKELGLVRGHKSSLIDLF